MSMRSLASPGTTPSSRENNSRGRTLEEIKNDLVYPMQTMHLNEVHEEHAQQKEQASYEPKTVSTAGIAEQVNALQRATSRWVESAAQQPPSPPPPTPPTPPVVASSVSERRLPNVPSRYSHTRGDAFEAALGPRPRPVRGSSPAAVTMTNTTATANTTSSSAPPKISSPAAIPTVSHPPSIAPNTTPTARTTRATPMFTGTRCAGCDKPTSGMTITAAGRQWHTDCFVCQNCHQDLEHIAFYEKDGLPYCALDYHEMFSTRCDYCSTPIEEKAIRALGKTYHQGHFFCRQCGKPFDESSAFMVHENHPYCEKDYLEKFGHKCKGCGEYITGELVGALGGDWHKECFVCAECGKAFTSATFFVRNNKPYCDQHYRPTLHSVKNNGTHSNASSRTPSRENMAQQPQSNTGSSTSGKKTCSRCQETIETAAVNAYGKDYHSHHFQCAHCDRLLSQYVPGIWQEGSSGELVCKMCAHAHKPSLH
ncbi:hypothetical protein BDF14DRAFT_1792340 [Spinellus fusiger]|nr:hypothetical protein BDF14DRAFT_1792340 [Spinellus fusiger]